MSALTNRREARERALATFHAALDRIIPPDESISLKGSKFVDFEDQVEEVVQAVLPTLLEERAALEDNAQVTGASRCPHCGSDRVYLEKQATQAERLSRHGPVVIREQGARCRGCGGSFSPSGLLVIGMDGGRVQTREKQGGNDSRWREDKVLTITSYLPGDGTREHPPTPLVTTYAATMGDTESFGHLVRIEAERRGIDRARTVLVVADGGNWIDPLCRREKSPSDGLPGLSQERLADRLRGDRVGGEAI